MAHDLGITFQQVQKYEKGANHVSAGRLHQMAVIMKVPITFFFEGLDGAGAVDAGVSRANQFLATRQGTFMLEVFPQLGKRTQSRL